MLPTKIGEIDEALTRLLAYADELIAARRAQPRDDLSRASPKRWTRRAA